MDLFDTIFATEKFECNLFARIKAFYQLHKFGVGFFTGFFTLAIYNIIVRAIA